jgi:tRNA(Ile2)-agmatinylcytidine synthase
MTLTELHLGMDDIDSPQGGCTTHFASLLVEELEKRDVFWIDYPNLIRLNPNIPFRTRGNGSVALRFRIDEKEVENLISTISEMVGSYAKKDYPNTNPGLVIINGTPPESIFNLSERALWRTLPVDLAKRVIDKLDLRYYSMGNRHGLIGALAAIGNRLLDDHTYEYIAYRSLDNSHKPRDIDPDSVRVMNKEMGSKLFSNIDPATGRTLIGPHGPDPVLFGVRGERAEDAMEGASYVISKQEIERWLIFRTNQGTEDHLRYRVDISNLRPYMAALVDGKVRTLPKMIRGGHLKFSIVDGMWQIDCMAYEPTGEFRKTLGSLYIGDLVRVHAGVRPRSYRHSMTLNVEGLEILQLMKMIKLENPFCPKCSKRMKSAGTKKGFKCPSCSYKDSKIEKIQTKIERPLKEKLYLPPPRAQRHLTRPLVRLNRRNSGLPNNLIEKWHHP